MYDFLRRRNAKRPAAFWIVFNIGTDLEFAECSNCRHEITPDTYDPYDMPTRCPECGADIKDVEFPD